MTARIAKGEWQRRFLGLLESLPAGIVLMDEQATIAAVNEAASRILGIPARELIGSSLRDRTFSLLGANGAPISDEGLATFQALSRGDPVVGAAQTVVRSDGSKVPVSVNAGLLRDADGAVEGVVVAISDLTQRRLAEDQARAQALKAAALFQVSRAVAWELDPQALARVALESSLDALGIDAGCVRLLDEKTNLLVPLATRGLPRDLESTVLNLRIAIGEGLAGTVAATGQLELIEDLEGDGRMKARGIAHHYRSAVYIPLTRENRVIGVLSGWSLRKRSFYREEVSTLITIGNMIGVALANARLYDRILASKREWQQTFDSMSEGIAIIGLDHRIMRANVALARMAGMTPAELVGRPCYEAIHGTPCTIDECPFDNCVSGKVAGGFERQEMNLGGRWLSLVLDPLTSDDGRVVGVVHTFKDITSSKKKQMTLERLYRLSRALSVNLDLDRVLSTAALEVAVGHEGVTTGIALLDQFGTQFRKAAISRGGQTSLREISYPLSMLDEKAVKTVFHERKTWLQNDFSEQSRFIGNPDLWRGYHTLMAAPLIAGDTPLGILFEAGAGPELPSADEVALFETMAHEIAVSIENARLYAQTDEALRRRALQMETVANVLSVASSAGADLKKAIGDAMRTAVSGLNVDVGMAYILDKDGKALSLMVDYVRRPDFHRGAQKLDLSKFPAARTALEQQKPVVTHTSQLPEGPEKDLVTRHGRKSVIIAPLVLKGTVAGVLIFSTVELEKQFDEDDAVLAQAVAGHLASILENVRLQLRTEDERARLDAIMSSMIEGLVVVDSQQAVIYANPAASRLLGIEGMTFVGRPLTEFQEAWVERVAARDILRNDWRRAVTRIQELPTVDFKLSVHGSDRNVQAILFNVGSEGTSLGTGALFRDVTREREVDRMKSEFVSVVSHELRTPMTSVYGFAELLLLHKKEIPVKQQEWIETIYRESKRLTDIVEDLLSVSRIESGKTPIKIAPTSIGPVVEDVVAQLSIGHPAHKIKTRIAAGLPEVLADRSKLHQVVYNLVDNAVKYSPRGGNVIVGAQHDPAGRQVVLSVTDEGIGIPAEELPRLFTRFHRVQRQETEGTRGTGLGLYIVKSFVELMNGRIRVESTVGAGSTFYVSLPVAC